MKGKHWLSRKIPSYPLPYAVICFLGLLLSFMTFLEFTGREWATGADAEVPNRELFALMPLCLHGTGCILFVQWRRKVCLWQTCALDQLLLCRERRGGHLLLSSFPLLSLRWWEVPLCRMRRRLISLSLHCTKELFAYLHRWFRKL